MRNPIVVARQERIAARAARKAEKAKGGKEFNRSWYDGIYTQAVKGQGEYAKRPEDCMYKDLWLAALKWINKGKRIYDFGCGPGQFVQLALEKGHRVVRACDCSSTAIALAKKRCIKHVGIFHICDLKSIKPYMFTNYDVATAFEVFEHIQNDIFVLKNIVPGRQLIFSVPNYGYRSHVRFFPAVSDVIKRYGKYMDIRGHKSIVVDKVENKIIWLINGIR
jgi:2-polyprenyl-3-methyl-5-hydroxy-6-metoxy-1,4-benzoquinol methylase